MICHLMQIHVISCSQKIAQAMSDDLLRGPSSLKEMQECFKCERWHRLLLLLLSAMIHLSKASSKLHQISEMLPLVVDRLTFLHRRSLEPALGNMDIHSLPGIVHVALEVPEWSRVLWLGLLRCVPRSCDQLAVARGKNYCHLPKAPGIRISALDDVRCRPGLSCIDGEFDPLNGGSFAGYRIALDTRWSCRDGLAFSRRRDHSVECQIFYGLCATPIGCLRGNLWREELIIASLVRVGRYVLLKRDFAQPLDAPGADIARHDDTQRKPMFWSKWRIIHLIGQKHIWREGLLQRDGASKTHLFPLKLRLI